MMKKYDELLQIPIDGDKIKIYTELNNEIGNQYERVVIGQRGPYVEFNSNQIHCDKLYIPKNQLYRLSDPKVYYIEFRTNNTNVKVYYQMRSVAYADYKIGNFYISPEHLFYIKDNQMEKCIKNKENISVIPEEFFETV